ncbi:MAG TPA: sodium/solute symporter [Planctomycetaceae bacterium]|nr:sodium/solute symporter [Planctomycetaceae bacterium]
MTASASTAGLTALDGVVVAAYLAGMLAMGVWIARRQRSTEDFFVGGRNLPAWAVGISIFASLFSTITYLGMPGEMFRSGLYYLTRELPIPLVLCVVWFVWLPFFMRLELTSAYEYLEKRFNYAVRALAAAFCLLLLFGWISVVVLTASRAMAGITRLSLDSTWAAEWLGVSGEDAAMYAIIAAVGLFSVLYTTLGGIRAVVWTDVVQFLILMAGAFFTMGAVASMSGSTPGDWIAVAGRQKYEHVEWFDWDVRTRSSVFTIALGMFFWFVCTHGANQIALQRYFSVKSMWAARRSYLTSALASTFIGVTMAGVGISLMYFVQDHELPSKAALASEAAGERIAAQDGLFPEFIRVYLPSGMRGLVIAALFAAAMSTIDSGSNSAATIVTVDFFRRWRRDTDRRHELRRARMLTAASGLIVVAYTIFLYRVSKGTDIITLCQKGFNCFLGPLGALFVLAMFSRRATSRSVIPAFLLGELVGVAASYWQELTALAANHWGGSVAALVGGELITAAGGDSRYAGMPFSTHLVVVSSWLVTLVAGLVLSSVLRTRATAEQQRWTWGAVARGS